MCIIIVKDGGIDLPDKDVIETCFNNHPHGAGYMFWDGENVVIRKGFTRMEAIYSSLGTLPRSAGVVIHFRQATHGGKSEALTHPFPVCDSYEEMRKLKNKTDAAMAHNGIFHTDDDAEGVSDSMQFAKLALFPIKHHLFEVGMETILNHAVGDSCVVIMSKRGEIKLFGSGWIKEDGLWYSNNSFRFEYYHQLEFVSTFPKIPKTPSHAYADTRNDCWTCDTCGAALDRDYACPRCDYGLVGIPTGKECEESFEDCHC